jgi:hypothetical protein
MGRRGRFGQRLRPLFAGHHLPALRFSLMTSAIPRVFTLFSVLAASLVVARTVWGEPPASKAAPVYVLSIWTDDADDQADALTQALRSRVRQTPGWSLLQATQSFETLAIALKCPPKPDFPCLQRIGDQLKADRYVWGTMDKKKAPAGLVSAELHLWTRLKPDTVARENYADNLKDPNDESLRAVAADLFTKLAPASAPTAIANADTPPPSGPSGERQTPDIAVATSPTTGSTTSDRFPTRTVIAYSAVVVGGGLLAASIVEAANWIGDSNRSNDDRKLVPRSVTDVCADPSSTAAKDACNSSKDAVTASTLGWLFAGLGAALLGTGVWLIASDDGPRGAPGNEVSSSALERRFKVLPSFGPRATSVELSVTF